MSLAEAIPAKANTNVTAIDISRQNAMSARFIFHDVFNSSYSDPLGSGTMRRIIYYVFIAIYYTDLQEWIRFMKQTFRYPRLWRTGKPFRFSNCLFQTLKMSYFAKNVISKLINHLSNKSGTEMGHLFWLPYNWIRWRNLSENIVCTSETSVTYLKINTPLTNQH